MTLLVVSAMSLHRLLRLVDDIAPCQLQTVMRILLNLDLKENNDNDTATLCNCFILK